MKVAKSISLDEELVFEIQKEARDKGLSFSEYVATIVSDGKNKEEEKLSLSLLNNKLILLNNKLIITKRLYDICFEKEINKIKKEKEELIEQKEARDNEIINRINYIEEKVPLKEIEWFEERDLNDPNQFSETKKKLDLYGIRISEIREYLSMKRQLTLK